MDLCKQRDNKQDNGIRCIVICEVHIAEVK